MAGHCPTLYLNSTCESLYQGINPKIIDRNGTSPLERFPDSFKSENAKKLLSQFPESVYFSIDDQKCSETGKVTMHRYRSYNGQIVNMKDTNKLGSGGFGNVYG